MISGVVPFYSIVESVKDETGIQNLRPYYDKIRRLIFRAEKIIGCGGSVKLKKKVYETEGVYFKYPEDFIEYEGVGSCCNPIPRCDISAKEDGFRLREKKSKVVLIYWGLQVDEEGYPITTSNHEEAVIAFIVWKLYSARVFLGLGNFNLKKDYEFIFNSEVGSARGNDAFPTIEQYYESSEINSIDRRLLFKSDPLRYNYCDEMITEDCEPDPEPQIPISIFYWQEEFTSTFITVIEDYEDNQENYFNGKANSNQQDFINGVNIEYTGIGRHCFGIRATDSSNWNIFDYLNNNVTSIFDKHYDSENQTLIFVSKAIYPAGTMNYKIIKL